MNAKKIITALGLAACLGGCIGKPFEAGGGPDGTNGTSQNPNPQCVVQGEDVQGQSGDTVNALSIACDNQALVAVDQVLSPTERHVICFSPDSNTTESLRIIPGSVDGNSNGVVCDSQGASFQADGDGPIAMQYNGSDGLVYVAPPQYVEASCTGKVVQSALPGCQVQ